MFRRWTLGRKVFISFIATGLISTITIGVSVLQTRAIGERLADVVDARFPAAGALVEFRSGMDGVTRGMNGILIPEVAEIPSEAEAGYKMIETNFARIEAAREAWRAIPHSTAADEKWAQIEGLYAAWAREMRDQFGASKAYHQALQRAQAPGAREVGEARAKAIAGWRATRKSFVALSKPLDELVVITRERVQREKAGAIASVRGGTITLLVGGSIALAALAAIGVFVSHSVRRTVRGLTAETAKLTEAVERGRLEIRGDPGTVGPEFRCVVEGLNQTVDAFARPIQLTSEYVSRISRGDLPPKITDTYRGDFDGIKLSLNTCIDAVHALTEDALALGAAAIEGSLARRADPSRHQGDYRRIIERVNGTLDAVVGPVSEAAEVLERLARRDLTARVGGSYRGDHAKIKDALNVTAAELERAMGQVARSSGQVAAAAAQIASSSQAVASGASEQAAALEETSASLESMASTTRHATESAEQADGLAQQARTLANDGGAAMAQMTGAMAKIRASAEGTSQIIKDINEIAFQTNLLALNAAVEAARAGDAGRGFAVVAEEVRSLALRSKTAASKTEELIRQSVREAGEGEVTAAHVHAKLGEIGAAVSKVSNIVAEISAVSKEQVSGIEQINRAVAQMNQVTQGNAASSEESSSAATELSGQAQHLSALVSTFQLGRDAATAAGGSGEAPAAAAPPLSDAGGPRRSRPRPRELARIG